MIKTKLFFILAICLLLPAEMVTANNNICNIKQKSWWDTSSQPVIQKRIRVNDRKLTGESGRTADGIRINLFADFELIPFIPNMFEERLNSIQNNCQNTHFYDPPIRLTTFNPSQIVVSANMRFRKRQCWYSGRFKNDLFWASSRANVKIDIVENKGSWSLKPNGYVNNIRSGGGALEFLPGLLNNKIENEFQDIANSLINKMVDFNDEIEKILKRSDFDETRLSGISMKFIDRKKNGKWLRYHAYIDERKSIGCKKAKSLMHRKF